MKKLFLTMVALVVAAMSYAQNTLVATLSHGEDISMFYGTYALRDAMNAAVSGDVINLSGGSFIGTTINKAIALRGAGIDAADPTYITGEFIICIPSDDPNRLSMEGIRTTATTIIRNCTLRNPYYLKCQFWGFTQESGGYTVNGTFVDCKIRNHYAFRNGGTLQFINCYVRHFTNEAGANGSAAFENCVILSYSNGYNLEYQTCSQHRNCIFYVADSNVNCTLPSTSMASNCISIGYRSNFFSGNLSNNNNHSATFEEVFRTFRGEYSEIETFELTDEAKEEYLGYDGTEIGMYGGPIPYDPTPSYPRITKMNVAKKTTADGKLSVEIEVSAAE